MAKKFVTVDDANNKLPQPIVDQLAADLNDLDGGSGIPSGGLPGQVLTKASSTSFDVEWQDPEGGAGDAETIRDTVGSFVQGGNNVTVTHNDVANTLTVATNATINDTDANLKNRANHTGTQSADTITDGTFNKAFTNSYASKIDGVQSGATANSTDAQLRDRAQHTGTQSADTITDGTTNKAFTAAEKTKLAALEEDNSALLNRANHTGTQAISTVTNLQTMLDGKVNGSGLSLAVVEEVPEVEVEGTIYIVPGSTGGGGGTADSVPYSGLPAGTTVSVYYNGSAWPSRPTSRTDITVQWVGGTEGTPPTGAVTNVDIWLRDSA